MQHITLRCRYSILSLLALLALSCANQIPPSGGPRDNVGPRVISVYPEPYSLNVSTDRIEIEFDEYVDKRSAMESIFISPPIEDLEFDWWGSSVEISFSSGLQQNTTYVVTIGTDVVDLEPSLKNRMEVAFSFPFSTGSSIDRGLIAGTVLPIAQNDELGGVMVYAYLLPTGRADTLNVMHSTPSYVTQAGRDGSFAFPHIRLGAYFMLSIRDASRNIVYDREEDEFAVAPSLVRITRLDTSYTRLVLQLAKDDTTAPRLVDVTPIDLNHVQVGFSEPIDTSRERRPVATIQDTLSGEQRSVYTVTPVLPALKTAILTTDFLEPESVYRVSLSGYADPAGNQARAATSSAIFTSGSRVDTLAPRLKSISVRDSAIDRSVTEDFLFTFSEPFMFGEWSPGRAELRTLSDGREHPIETRWVTESILGIRPEGELRSFAWYELKVLLQGIRDWKLDPITDSVAIVRFRTEDVYDTGIIEGVVSEILVPDTLGPVYVIARPVDGKTERGFRSLSGRSGEFSLSRIRPGLYTIHAFKDRNGNGEYDAGSPYPYRAAERRSGWTDTLKVRSRWPLEGVRITIP